MVKQGEVGDLGGRSAARWGRSLGRPISARGVVTQRPPGLTTGAGLLASQLGRRGVAAGGLWGRPRPGFGLPSWTN